MRLRKPLPRRSPAFAMLPSGGSALVGGPRHGGVLQPVHVGAAPQVAPETESRVSALCKASSTMLDTEGARPPPAAPACRA